MTKRTTSKPAASTALGYLPRNGYAGWVCTCGARAQRDRYIPGCFICERPGCKSQRADWVDEVQS